METVDWKHVQEGRPGGGWLVATDNGLGALTAWAAGTDNVRKMAANDTGRRVSVECSASDGTLLVWTEAFLVVDRGTVDDSAEAYLVEAGVPVPPRGWVWLIRRPLLFDDDQQFWSYLNQQILHHASRVPHPAELVPILQRTLANLYAR